MPYSFLATAAFGLEGIVSNELKRLGYSAKAEQGCARFTGELADGFRANLCLRTADRVLLLLDEKPVLSFEDLFQFVSSLPWENYLDRSSRIHVSGKCVRSQLMSVRDCQSIVKKAIVERLKKRLRVDLLPETGPRVPIEIALYRDQARLTIDMSGDALNRRGYRTWNGEAPLRETLAAALVTLSRYRGRDPFCDPFCGSGTIPIEAALIAKNRAPGLDRRFDSQRWAFLPAEAWMNAADEAQDKEFHGQYDIWGGDIDPRAVDIARDNARKAGVDDCVRFEVADAAKFRRDSRYGQLVTNPPYGERLMERQEAEELYRMLGRVWRTLPEGWRTLVLSSHTEFERAFGRPADKRRKLYNGMIKCDVFFYGNV